jgi:hypothetical protein
MYRRIIRGAYTAFAEKHWLLTQAHELTKSRREAWHLCLPFVPVVLDSKSFSPAATLESGKDRLIDNIFKRRD